MITIRSACLRKLLRIAIPFGLIPITVLLGSLLLDAQKHLFISFFVAILSILLFFSGFEQKNIGARRMVIVAVMIALSITGRLIPFFKPITSITVITAVYLGSESGFLVGSLSALISNFYFGQGPWTPFQMLAWGLIGLFAGILSNPLRKSKVFLLLYGILSGIIYSLIMDIWTVLWYNGQFDLKLYLAAIVTSLGHTLLYAISNFVFLWLMAKPFGEKLSRIKIKYGV